jgi:hypothetical protein
MSLPPELKSIIVNALSIENDTNIHARASRQIKTYLSVLNRRLDAGIPSEAVLQEEKDTTHILRLLTQIQREAVRDHTPGAKIQETTPPE